MADPSGELARLTAERDVLARRVVQLENRVKRRQRFRKTVTGVLVVLLAVSFTAATVAVWAKRNFLNTTVFSERVVPMVDDIEFRAALNREITSEVTKVIDAKGLLASFLPEQAKVLAVPLANAVNDFIRGEVGRFIDSKEFDSLWATVTRDAHRAAVALLRGEKTELASAEGGKVTLNLVPIINRVLAFIGQQSPQIFGKTVTLPTLTVQDAPKVAIERVESALGVNLEDGYGQVTVFETDELSAAQDAIALVERLTVLLVLLTAILIPLTLWASPHRRRTVLQLVIGIGLGMVLIRRFSYLLEDDILQRVQLDANRPAVETLLDVFVDPLRGACAWILAGLGMLAAAALLTGPYAWAHRVRQAAATGGRGLGDVVVRKTKGARDPEFARWLHTHRDQLRVAEVVVAFLALLVVDLSWLALILVTAAIAALELFFAGSEHEDDSV